MKSCHGKIHEQLKQDIDDCALSIRRCKAIGEAMAENTDALRRLLQELDERLADMRSKLPEAREVTTELGRIRQRIVRLQELRNMQELGSFQIQISRAMENAWRSLP